MSGDMYDYDIADELIGGLDTSGRGRSGSDDAHTRTRAGGKRRGSSGSARDRRSSIGSDRSTSKLATIRDQIRSRTSSTAAAGPRLSVEERVAARLAALHTHREANITGATVSSAASIAATEPDRGVESASAASPVASADVTAASVATTDPQRTRAGARGAPGVGKRTHAAPPPRARAAAGVRSPLSPSDRADSSSSLDISAADFTVGTIAARHLAEKRRNATTSASVSVASILEDAVIDESMDAPAPVVEPAIVAPRASEDYEDDFVSDDLPVAAPAVSRKLPAEGPAAPLYVASSATQAVQAEAPPAPRDSARLSFAELAAMFKTPVITPPAPPADRVHTPSRQAGASTEDFALTTEDRKNAAFADVVAAVPRSDLYAPLDRGATKLPDEATPTSMAPSDTAEQPGPLPQSPPSPLPAPAALIDWRSYMRPSSAGPTSPPARHEGSPPAESTQTTVEPVGSQQQTSTSTQEKVPDATVDAGSAGGADAGARAPVSSAPPIVSGSQQTPTGTAAPAVQPVALPAPPLPPGYAHVIYAVPASAIAATLQGALPPPLPGSVPGVTSMPEPGPKQTSRKRRSASPREKRRQAAHETATAALAIALRAAASAALAKSLRPVADKHAPSRGTTAEHAPVARRPAANDEDHRRGDAAVQSHVVQPRELAEDAVSRAAEHAGISPAAFARSVTPPRQRNAADTSFSRPRQSMHAHARSPERAAAVPNSVQRPSQAESVGPDGVPASHSSRADATPLPPRSVEPTAEMAAVSAAIAEAVAGKICAEQEVTRLRHEIEVLRVAAVATDSRVPTFSGHAGLARSVSPARDHRTSSDIAADTTGDSGRASARSPRGSRGAGLRSGAVDRDESPAAAGREPCAASSSPTAAGTPIGRHHERQQHVPASLPGAPAQPGMPHSAAASIPAHATLLDALASLAVAPPEGAAPITTAAALAAAHGTARTSGKPATSPVFVHHPALALQACKQYGLQVYVPYSAIEALQREIDMQDRMIEAYQADNELLRKRTSAGSPAAPAQSTAETNEGDAGARPRIKPSFERTPGELWSFEQPAQARSTAEDAARIAAGAELRSALSRDTEIQQLREDLEAVRSSSRVRENELKAELDAARKAKADMECRLAGVDIPAVRAFAVEENESIRQLRVQLAEQRSRYEGELGQLRTKLAWYIDNQAIIDADAATIAAQADTIRDLQSRLMRTRARPEGGAETTHASAAEPTDRDRSLLRAEAKIKELQTQVEQLREAFRKKNPDSLVNLIHEAKGASGAVGEQATLLAELRTMRDKSVETEAAHERRLRALRQEFERIKAEHIRRESELQERVRALEKELHETKKAPEIRRAAQSGAGEHKREEALRARVTELEGELKHVREFYQQKLKGAGESSHAGRPPTAGTGARGHGARATTVSARSRGRGAPLRGAAAPVAARANTTVTTTDHPSALHSISTIQVLDVSAACTEPGDEQLLPAGAAFEGEPSASARLGGPTLSASPARAGRVDKGNVESTNGGVSNNPQLTKLQEESETLRRELEELRAERDDLQRKLQRVEAEAKEVTQQSTKSALADSKVPADREAESKYVDKKEGPVAALVSLATSRQLGLQAQVDALYGALQVLESRAEARELELLRAERVVANAHNAAEASLREHYEAIIRMKDQALEACKHEIVHLVAEVNELRAA